MPVDVLIKFRVVIYASSQISSEDIIVGSNALAYCEFGRKKRFVKSGTRVRRQKETGIRFLNVFLISFI